MTDVSAHDAAHDAPEVLSSERIYDRWLGLRVDKLRYPSGYETSHDVVEHHGGVTLLPIDAEGNVLFVSQYRHPIGRVLLELPAGTLDSGEDPEVCAQRELQEETGYRAANIERIGGFYSAPGYCTEYLPVYLCTELVESRLQGDEDSIELVRIPFDDALRMVAAGEIEDAKSLAALLLYNLRPT
ncbi:MAG: NUDIX hydrolase [Chloroflexi bacterium]|nr:NUDIX hydrolase [Chloroflexota bacterium]